MLRKTYRFQAEPATEIPRELDPDLLGLTALGGGEPRTAELTGTKALMLAVLENGIATYLGRTGRPRDEAESWVADTRAQSPFSFTVLCDTLGLDAGDVRTALRRLRATGTPRRRIIGRRKKVQWTTRMSARTTA